MALGLGFRFQALRCRVQGLAFRALGFSCGTWGFGG